MGGELEIVAHFPQGKVRISQFQDVRGRPARDFATEEKGASAISDRPGGPPVQDVGRP
jgi:hypothetical protein